MNRLPQLVLEQIFENLNVQDLCSTRLVCFQWNQMFLWKMKFSNSNFLKSLHYVALQTDEQMELFLSTFGRAKIPIAFPRFLWNIHVGTDAQLNAFGTLYENCIVELCISDFNSDDFMVDRMLGNDCLVFDKAALERISSVLHKVSHSLEVLQISIGYLCYEEVAAAWMIGLEKLEEECDDISVPLLPKLSILDIKCSRIYPWVKAVVRNAPVLKFFTPTPFLPWHRPELNGMLRDFGRNIQDLDYDPYGSEIQEYSKQWFDANARRLKFQLNVYDFMKLDDKVHQRILKDQIKNVVAIHSTTHDAFDSRNLALDLFSVFPRVHSLETTSVTWLENPLKVLSPTQLPQLKRVVLDENATAQEFPVELSYVYPNVVEFRLGVTTNRERTYTPLPYYKLFPNVTKLQLDNEVTRNLSCLLNNFTQVRWLTISYARWQHYNIEPHDFELECGAKPHVASFQKLERLEYIKMNGKEEVFSKLVSSAKASALTSLKDVYFWHMICPDSVIFNSELKAEEFRNDLKKRAILHVEQLLRYCKIQWWISVVNQMSVAEKVV